jgi:DNA-binding transcriptional LysR family regulator
MLARAGLYVDEVARRGSIRKAAERLRIAPSAIDRQILQLEEQLGTPLFERLPHGLRLTTAGEMLVDAIRRWRRDFDRVRSQIDDLQGLRRGEVCVAIVEGATEFFSKSLITFRQRYPGIAFRIRVAGAPAVADLVLNGEAEIGLTFNPPETHTLRVERTLIYQLGMVVPPSHPLASRGEISLAEASDHPLVIPDETISLRAVLDHAWARSVGGVPRFAVMASSIGCIKSLVKAGRGLGALTALDAFAEIQNKELVFLPLSDSKIMLSVLSVVSASRRALSLPASLLLQHLAAEMLGESTLGI